jgi:hypothetical protein
VSFIDRIAESPDDWTAARVIDELPRRMYDEGDRRRDPDIPPWLREVLVVCDFDAHVQMEGFLGWFDNRGSEDLRLVADALRSIGMPNDARLLEEAATVLAPSQLDADRSFEIGSVSSFAERHPAVTPQQYERIRDIENRLYLNDATGADLHALLIAHAASGLASGAM